MSMLDDLINEETKKFASNPENYESIFKMAKHQKQEAQRNLDNDGKNQQANERH